MNTDIRKHSDIDVERLIKIGNAVNNVKLDISNYGITLEIYDATFSSDSPTLLNSDVFIYVAGDVVYSYCLNGEREFIDGPWFDDLPEILDAIELELQDPDRIKAYNKLKEEHDKTERHRVLVEKYKQIRASLENERYAYMIDRMGNVSVVDRVFKRIRFLQAEDALTLKYKIIARPDPVQSILSEVFDEKLT